MARPPLHPLLTLLIIIAGSLRPALAQDPPRLGSPPSGLVNAATLAPSLSVELKYASTDNFMRRNVYGDLRRCYLQLEAAKKLAAAARLLRSLRPDLHLHALDCARPRQVQELMWRLVRGTPAQRYVANPRTGSMHTYGCAVDLTLADARSSPLDLGTPFDAAGRRAQPVAERSLHLEGKLTAAQWANRLLLRLVMVQAGFIPLDIEWWHFDCAPPAEARRRFTGWP